MHTNECKILISYASEDYDFAKRLYNDLKRIGGVIPWLDREDLMPGQKWAEEIPNVIEDCRYLLFLISENSITKKGYIQKEQKIALDILDEYPPNHVFIIPARIDHTEPVCEKLKRIHYADFTISYENGLNQIKTTISSNYPIHFLPSHKNDQDKRMSVTKVIKFVNRDWELRKITNKYGPTYVLLVGPMGFGKTRLLEEVKFNLEKQNWSCINIDLSIKRKCRLFHEITDCFLDIFGKDNFREFNLENPEDAGSEIAYHIEQFTRRNHNKGILIQIDGAETIDINLAKELLNHFIPSFADTISQASDPLQLRFLISGRYEILTWENFHSKIPLSKIILTPFSFEFIIQTVENVDSLKELNRDYSYKNEFSAWLMYFTGGHPKCMAEIINNEYGLRINTILRRQGVLYNDIICPVIEDLKKNIYGELQSASNILMILSVVRKFNGLMLKYLIQKDIIKLSEDQQHINLWQLEEMLLQTYLIRRNEGFLQDDIARRLLSNELRIENLNLFLKICYHAIIFYEDRLSQTETHRRDIIAVELLFQKMQYIAYKENANKELFFRQVDVVLNDLVLLSEHAIVDGFKQLLNIDWEFRFNFNYLFRNNTYEDDHPFGELIERVTMFSEKLRTENQNDV
jgi:hypothetical protein